MGEPTQPVFLSYASEDADAARRIAENTSRGGSGHLARPRARLRGGDAWDASIRERIADVRALRADHLRPTPKRVGRRAISDWSGGSPWSARG
jgi:hypothetical protein